MHQAFDVVCRLSYVAKREVRLALAYFSMLGHSSTSSAYLCKSLARHNRQMRHWKSFTCVLVVDIVVVNFKFDLYMQYSSRKTWFRTKNQRACGACVCALLILLLPLTMVHSIFKSWSFFHTVVSSLWRLCAHMSFLEILIGAFAALRVHSRSRVYVQTQREPFGLFNPI